jgi:hypothetical protein
LKNFMNKKIIIKNYIWIKMSEPVIRDALLLKCKSAIEELHMEVDRL